MTSDKNGELFLCRMHEDLGFWDEVYIKPWCRVSAYCVGLLLGYIFYKKKNPTIRLVSIGYYRYILF